MGGNRISKPPLEAGPERTKSWRKSCARPSPAQNMPHLNNGDLPSIAQALRVWKCRRKAGRQFADTHYHPHRA